MKVLEARSYEGRRRFARWGLVALAVVIVAAVAAGAYAFGRSHGGSPHAAGHGAGSASGGNGGGSGGAGAHHARTVSLRLVSSTPARGATGVPSNSTITIRFSSPVEPASVVPTLSPPVAGTWGQPSPTTMEFFPSAPLVPFSTETVTVPGGTGGAQSVSGTHLASTTTVSFKVADGSMLRMQQLLSGLNYLPLAFTASSPAPTPADAAEPQQGSFAWRWTTLPPDLTTQWTPGYEDVITKGAIMSFESQNGLSVDGLAGPQVWSAVLAAAGAAKVDPSPYTYVLVSKVVPENLTLWNNGVTQFTNVPVNTGLHGADTTDGTYPVFEHVTASEMKGTNPDGSKYDDPNVPWASYFNGGEALHGFVRATYGTPQSNGCVEMAVANAGQIWPLTPIGTLVTVVGPAS